MFGMFDWLKVALCLLSVAVALCAFTGRAADPDLPFGPELPIDPINPSEADEDDEPGHGKEPILYFFGKFAADSGFGLLEEYTQRIAANPANYEAYICRAFARVASLWKEYKVVSFATGLRRNRETGLMDFDLHLYETMASMRDYDKMDEVYGIAVPVLKAAIDDLNKLPKDWTGCMEVSKEKGFDVDEPVYVDYADVQLAKSMFCEMITIVCLVRGYRDPVTGMPGGTNPEALEEARLWWTASIMELNSFNVAWGTRRDFNKNHFFEINGNVSGILSDCMQNFLDLPYWTVRFDLSPLEGIAFRSHERTEWGKAKQRAKKAYFSGAHLDVSFRSLFEGKVSELYGTFPEFYGNSLNLDTLDDSTCGGMLPGMSRTKLGYWEGLFGYVYPYTADDTVKHQGVIYKLPKGTTNNPENPATYPTRPAAAITLLDPTRDGYKFTGWSNGGVIPIGAEETLTFEATFDPLPPWKIGATADDTVTAWTNGTTLVVEGRGAMVNFTGVPKGKDRSWWRAYMENVMPVAPWDVDITVAEFGAQVTSIGTYALADCAALKTLVLHGDPPALGTGNDLSGVERILVREDALEKFKADSVWSAYEAKFKLLQPEGPPEGGKENPWKIGATADDTVVAWTNGTTLAIEGTGKMKDFGAVAEGSDSTGEVAPWAKGDIALATVGSDVTSLGNAAFADSPTGEGAEIVFKNPAAVINIGAFVGDGGAKTNVPAVKVETLDKDGQVRHVAPSGFRDVANRQRVYPTLQAAIDAAASAVTPRIFSGLITIFR